MMMIPTGSSRPPKQALTFSKARVFVGQLEPYVTEADLYPVFSCYGRILYLNVVRHSTTVTPNEERRIPTAFVWYESTAEADAAIAALHNVFTFSSPDEDESKKRYIQVSYADKSPQCTPWGKWQKKHAEMQRHNNVNFNTQKKNRTTGRVNAVHLNPAPATMPNFQDLGTDPIISMSHLPSFAGAIKAGENEALPILDHGITAAFGLASSESSDINHSYHDADPWLNVLNMRK